MYLNIRRFGVKYHAIFLRVAPTALVKLLSVTTNQRRLISNKLLIFQLPYFIFQGP